MLQPPFLPGVGAGRLKGDAQFVYTVPLIQPSVGSKTTPWTQGRDSSRRSGQSAVLLHSLLGWNSGLACAFLAPLLFSLLSLFVKLMEGRVNPFEVAFARTSVSAALGIPIAAYMGIAQVCQHRENITMLALRGIFGAAAIVTHYFSLLSLPIADAAVVGCMHPVITAVAARCLLGEDMGKLRILGSLISLCGVVIITQPESLMGSDGERLYGVGMGVLSAALSSGGSLCIRAIGGREQALTMSLWFQVMGMVMCSPPLLMGFPDKVELPGAFNACLLIAMGVLSFLGQLLLTRSLQLLPAFMALSLSFTVVAYSYLYGVLIFNDEVTFEGIAGTLMVTVGVLCVLMRKHGPKKPRKLIMLARIKGASESGVHAE